MRATEFITEVFQPGKTNWEWLRRGSEEANAQFKVGDREYRWDAFTQRTNPKKWEIQFRLIRNDTDPDKLDLFGKTGTGNSTEVLSTAVDITREFIKEYGLDKVEEITFNAKEDSRIGLYAKMIQRLLPDWDLYQKYNKTNGMEYHLTDRRAYDKPDNKLGEEVLDEIERLRPSDYQGGKSSLVDKQYGKTVRKLPGGSGLLYSTNEGRWGGIEIKLWDPKGQDYIMAKSLAGTPQPVKQRRESEYSYYDRLGNWQQLQKTLMAPGQLIGRLSLSEFPDLPLKGALQVDSITVDEDYRGMSLAKALYGIVLTIMKRPLLAGSSQTPGGRRNWVSLANIPGVQMKCYFVIYEEDLEPIKPNENDNDWDKRDIQSHNKQISKTIDIIMGKLGGQYIGDFAGEDFFSFDVRPNATSQELEAVVKTKLNQVYNNYKSNTGLYAVWTG